MNYRTVQMTLLLMLFLPLVAVKLLKRLEAACGCHACAGTHDRRSSGPAEPL